MAGDVSRVDRIMDGTGRAENRGGHRIMKQPTTLGDLMDRYWERVQAQKAKYAAERKAAKNA